MTSRDVTIALLVAIAGVALGLEVVARRTAWVPTLGAVLGAVARRPGGRVALFAVWAWTGWHFFAR
jgi:Family of unknown function (DUF6186)